MSETISPFYLKPDDYVRDLDMFKHYVMDAASYLHINTGQPIKYCAKWVIDNLKVGGKYTIKDPEVTYLERGDNGDRVKKKIPLTKYLQTSIANRELIAPTFTTYLHPEVKQSLLSMSIDDLVKKRGVAKKAMFAAKAVKNKFLANLKNIEQTGRKLSGNAISGAHVVASTPLFNKTAHSTLTSNCRVTTGYGSANNERFLSGNRHYYHRDTVLNNITSVTRNTNYEELSEIIRKYDLKLPTVEDTMKVIRYSTDLYWLQKEWIAEIQSMVSKLNPLQRAAFVYTGDLYHLMVFNEAFVRKMLTELSTKVTGSIEDPVKQIKRNPDEYIYLAHRICAAEMRGKAKDYSLLKDDDERSTVALTTQNIANTLNNYADLIHCLWVTTNLPASVAFFPSSIRRVVLTGDTDSSIFTVQDWIIWYCGKLSFDQRASSVKEAVVFLASATITHVLSVMSANFGIIQQRLKQISMKNEYSFPMFAPTQLGKHYFALRDGQEGSIFEEDDLEKKGVGLVSSAIPKDVMVIAEKMMMDILKDIKNEGKVSIEKYIKIVVGVEKMLDESLKAGQTKYLRRVSLKDMASYKQEEELSPYQRHHLYMAVFAPDYGDIEPPPYDTLKIAVGFKTTSQFNEWLETMPNRAMSARMTEWLNSNGKKDIKTFYIPTEILIRHGILKELLPIVDRRRIISDITRCFAVIMETLNVYYMGDKTDRLLMDYYG